MKDRVIDSITLHITPLQWELLPNTLGRDSYQRTVHILCFKLVISYKIKYKKV